MMANIDSKDIQETKQWFAGLFDRVAPTYDQVDPKFFDYFGRRLVDLSRITTGADVLDVATGRGAILFPAANAVGPNGHVMGIDLSEMMVQETSEAIRQLGLKNARVQCMDAERLQFPDGSFDYVLCGLSIFFFPQHELALSEMQRVLRPGGVIGITTFWRDDQRWKWMGELFNKYLPPAPLEESTTEEEPPEPDFRSHAGMKELMIDSGFVEPQVVGEEQDFFYSDEEGWWSTIWSHGMRARLEKIERTAGQDALMQFKADAFKRLQTSKQSDGIPHMWSVLFTLAIKPQAYRS